ncbi:hypothetical protein C8J57DRAFT_1210783 [Mycena rebaudengoi]|nr:hypothetical protein C8J57DRAFT_1210783 [Mycena rebaudengoi]
MDMLTNLAKEFAGQSAPSSPSHPHSSPFQPPNGFTELDLDDHKHTVSKATQENPEDKEYFEQASKHVEANTSEHRPPSDDEREAAAHAHKKLYKEGADATSMDADAVGGAAAAEAIQKFLSGGGGDTKDLVAFAMTEASKLLSGSGAGADAGFKGQVMQKAAMMAFKSQLGGDKGGGGAMSLLSKFM